MLGTLPAAIEPDEVTAAVQEPVEVTATDKEPDADLIIVEGERLFSADEVSNIVRNRLARQRKKIAAERKRLISEVAKLTAQLLAERNDR